MPSLTAGAQQKLDCDPESWESCWSEQASAFSIHLVATPVIPRVLHHLQYYAYFGGAARHGDCACPGRTWPGRLLQADSRFTVVRPYLCVGRP